MESSKYIVNFALSFTSGVNFSGPFKPATQMCAVMPHVKGLTHSETFGPFHVKCPMRVAEPFQMFL